MTTRRTRPHTRSGPEQRDSQRHVLRLYITGSTPQSTLAVRNVKAICEKYLRSRYELEVVDIYQRPARTKGEQIVATPTLVKVLPAPTRRLMGGLSSEERVLLGIDLRARER